MVFGWEFRCCLFFFWLSVFQWIFMGFIVGFCELIFWFFGAFGQGLLLSFLVMFA